ncbi:MAG: 2-amino-4-hydroxy-6-hydroxymethyldihydropteridine diphosphokinase [Candidatus Omnitrophica bacterium]|nr:2-amino-4-hydroxy-6-hydroxymethyldihydropteridine diphosphokinase [Candidatus Omnitrophota bacterium]MBU1524314.1 2-amino-4-hydroxy-6-hydroxymethyldihydropteridine diphosphokinase [Candidatus Omnitrophota bacterium]MBU2436156.1 2-amino-4-hydroxy-6-hydroxymethyldihydropteridine diphosphokinase [Candidatus Omnitrophota bacterium]MBU2504224.1 2-amino-4-hydroxy-6-hydroxymethyldihydropteridine diphosphokinase [Candidatus Omnitrophota bacterium]
MINVFIGIGSNLGDRLENIHKAIKCLRDTNGIEIEKISSIIETEALGGQPQGKFLNGVVKIKTDLLPQEILAILQDIENKLGRARTIKTPPLEVSGGSIPMDKNGPRTIDLDILLYGNQIVNEPDLKIPHPRMLERNFVMRPLLEIEPEIAELVKVIK